MKKLIIDLKKGQYELVDICWSHLGTRDEALVWRSFT